MGERTWKKAGLAANEYKYFMRNSITWKWIEKSCEPLSLVRRACHYSVVRLRSQAIQGKGYDLLSLVGRVGYNDGVGLRSQVTKGKGTEPLERLGLPAFGLCFGLE